MTKRNLAGIIFKSTPTSVSEYRIGDRLDNDYYHIYAYNRRLRTNDFIVSSNVLGSTFERNFSCGIWHIVQDIKKLEDD